jgi:hypothetical protein
MIELNQVMLNLGANHFSHFSLFIHINIHYYLKAHPNSDSLAKITSFIDIRKCFYSKLSF